MPRHKDHYEIFLIFNDVNRAMGDSMVGTSTSPTNRQNTSLTQSTNKQWDLGPDLEASSIWKRGTSIFPYLFKNNIIQIGIAALLLLASFCILAFKWDALLLPIHLQNTTTTPSVAPLNLANWWMRVQSFLGLGLLDLGTLLVALFVWYSRIRDDWEKHLPKRMSVFFFYLGRPVIICRYVWLAGVDDLRAWGQQVAAQAAYNQRYLKFSPGIKTRDPNLIVMTKDDTICKHYAICFQLNELPSSLTEEVGMCRYQNFAAKDSNVNSIPSEIVATLGAVADWQINPDNL